jgi:hypothetical protein
MGLRAPLSIAAAALLLAPPVVAAPARPQSPQEAAGGQATSLVTVEFRAMAPGGTPVVDLKPEEVTVKIGGRPREIAALELIRAGASDGARAAAETGTPAEPYVTNAPLMAGRDVVLLVDEEGIPAGKEAVVKAALGELMAALTPADRVSLLTARGGPARAAPTTEHKRVLDALSLLSGRAFRGETAAEAVCRSRINLSALVDVLASIVPSPSGTVVFVTDGFTPPTVVEEIARGQGPAGPCELMPRDLATLSSAAAASHAQFFTLQVIDDGLLASATASEMTREAARTGSTLNAPGTAVASRTEMTAGLEHVAGLTGNAIIRLIGSSAPAMQRIARETSAFYVAAVGMPASERTGGTQRLEVSVNRPNVVVQSQARIDVAALGAPAGKPGKGGALTPREMLSVARSFHGLSLRAIVYTSRASSDGKLRAVALFEPTDPSVKVAAAAAALFDAKGKVRAQWMAQSAELTGTPMIAALAAPGPGVYRLRVAATDASGLGATIDEDVTVEATARDAAWVSPLVLGVPSGQAFAPRLQFADEAVAVAMVEVAGLPRTAAVSATFELAAREDGPAVATLPGETRTSSGGTTVAFVGIPIGPMPPGDVVVRAVIAVNGQPLAARPTRTLRKTAR